MKSHGFTGSHQTHSSREKHTTAILKLCLRGKEEFGGLERMTSNAHAVSTRAAPRAVQCTCALHVHLRVSSTTLRTNNAKMSKAELTVREMHFEKARPIFFSVFYKLTLWQKPLLFKTGGDASLPLLCSITVILCENMPDLLGTNIPYSLLHVSPSVSFPQVIKQYFGWLDKYRNKPPSAVGADGKIFM